jgi:hypothetical protein
LVAASSVALGVQIPRAQHEARDKLPVLAGTRGPDENIALVGEHYLLRSFVTNSRRRGIPESVVMRMSGHRTRNVFDRYNIVEDEDVRNAVRVIEAGAAEQLATSQPRRSWLLDKIWTPRAGAPPGSTKAPRAKCS